MYKHRELWLICSSRGSFSLSLLLPRRLTWVSVMKQQNDRLPQMSWSWMDSVSSSIDLAILSCFFSFALLRGQCGGCLRCSLALSALG